MISAARESGPFLREQASGLNEKTSASSASSIRGTTVLMLLTVLAGMPPSALHCSFLGGWHTRIAGAGAWVAYCAAGSLLNQFIWSSEGSFVCSRCGGVLLSGVRRKSCPLDPFAVYP